MPITSKNVTITTSATLMHTSASNGCRLYLYSASGGHDITIGPATVASGTGFVLSSSKTSELTIDLPPGDSLYGIVASSTHTIRITVVEY
jgi:hypothetical protein